GASTRGAALPRGGVRALQDRSVLADGDEPGVAPRKAEEIEGGAGLALLPVDSVGARHDGPEVADADPFRARPSQSAQRRRQPGPLGAPGSAARVFVDRLRVRESRSDSEPAARAPGDRKEMVARPGVDSLPANAVGARC